MSRLVSIFSLLLLAGFCLIFFHSELHHEHCGQIDHQGHHDFCRLVQSAHVTAGQALLPLGSLPSNALLLPRTDLDAAALLERLVWAPPSEPAAVPLLYLSHHTLRI